MRIARHADCLEVDKAESWQCLGENWRDKKKEPKYTRHLIKVLVHGQSQFIVLGPVEQGFLKGRHGDSWHPGWRTLHSNSDSVEFPQKSGSKPAERNTFCFVRTRSPQEGQNPPTSAKDLPGPEERDCADGWNTRRVSSSLKSALNPPDIAGVEWDLLHPSRL